MVAAESLGKIVRLPRLDGGWKEVAACTGPASYARSGFAYGWTKSDGPHDDCGDVGREASVGFSVLEYMDGDGEVDRRVGAGDVAEVCMNPGTEPGLTCSGGGRVVSGLAKLDTVLARPRVKTSPGREGRDEDAVDAACGSALDASQANQLVARKDDAKQAHRKAA
jgi:hypothetical protein